MMADIIFCHLLYIDVLDVDFESYPETNLLRRVLPSILGCNLVQALSEPSGYQVPSLVRWVGLDCSAPPLSHGENPQLLKGRAGRRVTSSASEVSGFWAAETL
jgi:hypothetical protein